MSIIFARILIFDAEHLMKIFNRKLREAVKYYFADFVRKGGGLPPKSVTPFLPGKKSVKGGTPQIRNLFFGPKSGIF